MTTKTQLVTTVCGKKKYIFDRKKRFENRKKRKNAL